MQGGRVPSQGQSREGGATSRCLPLPSLQPTCTPRAHVPCFDSQDCIPGGCRATVTAPQTAVPETKPNTNLRGHSTCTRVACQLTTANLQGSTPPFALPTCSRRQCRQAAASAITPHKQKKKAACQTDRLTLCRDHTVTHTHTAAAPTRVNKPATWPAPQTSTGRPHPQQQQQRKKDTTHSSKPGTNKRQNPKQSGKIATSISLQRVRRQPKPQ